jgi:hypothetical protein
MTQNQKADNRSPWPACADCHVGEVNLPATASADQPTPGEADGDDGWERLDVSADLGPRRDEVQRQAREAFARALERARARMEPEK